LDPLLGNVEFDLVEGLDKHTDKEASFINYLYLLTLSYLLSELFFQNLEPNRYTASICFGYWNFDSSFLH
jgi:hypothetical protein